MPDKVQKAIDLLRLLNMTHRTTHIARDLSGGEKQRVVMARQLAKNPCSSWRTSPPGHGRTADSFQRLVKYVHDKGYAW